MLLIASAALISVLTLTQTAQLIATDPVVWHMVNVNDEVSQGDAHLLTTSLGMSVLIDVGGYESAKRKLLPYLRAQHIESVDHVFVTHPHKDHYGGLMALMEGGIRFKKVYFNLPDKPTCDAEIPWGCDYKDVLAVQARIKGSGAELSTVGQRFRVDLGFRSHLTVIYAFDNTSTPVGPLDINDMSLIIRFRHQDSSVLFTGDLNALIGHYLSQVNEDLHATILKVPHHGTEGVAPNAFFEKVNPEIAMVPAPLWLWCSARSERIRHWHDAHHVPTYVNGIHGHVVTTFGDHGAVVAAEHGERSRNPLLMCAESGQGGLPAFAQ
ncbi:hypothetical protein LPB72_22730 [Hydrogenophaga crassostreae]|uniref:Metallo-beta-lactamase domain-containing protein n=1 Tax=Hydrogenophaga crassostreae TaxID=1763535 RepID=A0A167GFX8_9BURK|nr:hypothetical protein LPB072_00455 [Hydrogenophaga crassostreae]OAD39397.1 hypothetical protein LPB72_22730 [Hydrogenophaga crassostreae]